MRATGGSSSADGSEASAKLKRGRRKSHATTVMQAHVRVPGLPQQMLLLPLLASDTGEDVVHKALETLQSAGTSDAANALPTTLASFYTLHPSKGNGDPSFTEQPLRRDAYVKSKLNFPYMATLLLDTARIRALKSNSTLRREAEQASVVSKRRRQRIAQKEQARAESDVEDMRRCAAYEMDRPPPAPARFAAEKGPDLPATGAGPPAGGGKEGELPSPPLHSALPADGRWRAQIEADVGAGFALQAEERRRRGCLEEEAATRCAAAAALCAERGAGLRSAERKARLLAGAVGRIHSAVEDARVRRERRAARPPRPYQNLRVGRLGASKLQDRRRCSSEVREEVVRSRIAALGY
ncbi:hypothetical protein DIPPA_18499 [Diplonema papillatum]|nr:hypothetical protein DIPPA_18499 [Diplonema papillatum]